MCIFNGYCLLEESTGAVDEPESQTAADAQPESQTTADAQPERSNTSSSFLVLGGFENKTVPKVSMRTLF